MNYHATTTKFFLYANSKGGLTRVEAPGSDTTNQIRVEEYDRSFKFLSGKYIAYDGLPVWGGFYAGENYNFIITGQNNPNESDSVEVIRVLKYSKDWQYLGKASVYGANTYKPFDAGTVSCAESGGILHILTCHEMYKSSDGKNHQASMGLTLRESDMTVTETNCTVSSFIGYVSHSFNQLIMVDSQGNLILANHGDAYPRTMSMEIAVNKAGTAVPQNSNSYRGGDRVASVDTDRFPGKTGYNYTGAMLGGMAETTSGYLLAYTQEPSAALGDLYQVKLAYIAKKDLKYEQFIDVRGVIGIADVVSNSFQVKQLTNAKADLMNFNPSTYPDQGNPFLVPTSLSGGYIIWKSGKGEISWTTYDASGQTGAIRTGSGKLSDCQPIFFNGKVVWYANHSDSLTFYTLDSSGLTAVDPTAAPPAPSAPVLPDNPSDIFRDVAANHWALDYIRTCVEKGVVNGVGDGMFNPNGEVTYRDFIVMLTRACYAEDVSRITDTEGKPWYYPNMAVARDCYLTTNTDIRKYGGWPEPVVADNAINRYEMAAVLSGAAHSYGKHGINLGWPEYLRTAVKDFDQFYNSDTGFRSSYGPSVSTCYTLGVLTGAEDGCFHGERTVTRAQACAVIMRMMDLIGDPPAGESHGIMIIYDCDKADPRTVGYEIPEGQAYSFVSPVFPGYTADRPVVSGVMGRCIRCVTVTYTPN